MQHLTLGAAHHGPVTALVLRGNDVHAAIHGRVHTYDAKPVRSSERGRCSRAASTA